MPPCVTGFRHVPPYAVVCHRVLPRTAACDPYPASRTTRRVPHVVASHTPHRVVVSRTTYPTLPRPACCIPTLRKPTGREQSFNTLFPPGLSSSSPPGSKADSRPQNKTPPIGVGTVPEKRRCLNDTTYNIPPDADNCIRGDFLEKSVLRNSLLLKIRKFDRMSSKRFFAAYSVTTLIWGKFPVRLFT